MGVVEHQHQRCVSFGQRDGQPVQTVEHGARSIVILANAGGGTPEHRSGARRAAGE